MAFWVCLVGFLLFASWGLFFVIVVFCVFLALFLLFFCFWVVVFFCCCSAELMKILTISKWLLKDYTKLC